MESDSSTKEFADKIVSTTAQSSEFINSRLTKVKKSFEQRISKSYITGCTWVQTNDEFANTLYTFRTNNELLITTNGNVKKAHYELLVDNNSILITNDDIIEHHNLINVQNDFMFLNKISSDSVIILANQTKFKDAIKSDLNKQAKQYQSLK